MQTQLADAQLPAQATHPDGSNPVSNQDAHTVHFPVHAACLDSIMSSTTAL